MDIVSFIMEHFFQPDYFQFYIMAGLALVAWLLTIWKINKIYEMVFRDNMAVGTLINRTRRLEALINGDLTNKER